MRKISHIVENRSRFSESLMNVFDDAIAPVASPKKVDFDTVTVDSFSMNILNDGHQNESYFNNEDFSKITKEEFLESIFGPSLNFTDKNLTIRERIRRVLHSNYMHLAIIILVLLDSFCVTIELIIDLENKSNNHALHVVEEVFKYLGFAILSFFVIEICFKIIFTFHDLVKSKLEIVDAIVVIVSFVADLIFIIHESTLAAIGL